MAIFVDQVGYLPSSAKIAISTIPCKYQIIRSSDNVSVFEGQTEDMISDECSGDKVYKIDFSAFTEDGTYYILAGNNGRSYEFSIGSNVYDDLFRDSLKCFYFQRCGCELRKEHAGIYIHPSCHTDMSIMLEDYIQKTENPQMYDMTGGWHDAGDYGRYSTAGAVALAHLLYAYELFPESFDMGLNIPESGNGIPDILNECLYELNWLLKMQDKDGGVYHKLTAFRHAEFIMPDDDKDRFLIFPKSSLATADFAAIMSLASRVYRPFLNEFADTALSAAKRAYKWLNDHPYAYTPNPEGCNTGEYDDETDIDERLWATAELLRMDPANRAEYLSELDALTEEVNSKVDFGWEDVSALASLAITMDPRHNAGMLEAKYKDAVLYEAARISNIFKASGYNVGMEPEDFVWGSNMVVLNRAMLLILASKLLDGETSEKYIKAAMAHIHYLLGRNPLNISYVTGFGTNPVKRPHSRVCHCDGIDAPIPGFVSGGPYGKFCDAVALANIPKGTAPMKCFIDDVGSYSTNEITIYWNSPLVFVCAFLRAYVKRNGGK